MTLTCIIKQEKLVFILVILYIWEYLRVFTKFFTGSRVSEDFQFRVSGSRNNRKRTALGVGLGARKEGGQSREWLRQRMVEAENNFADIT